MRNIFLFIRRYFNFLLFIALQVICIASIVRYSKYHEAAFNKQANQLTGRINEKVSSIQYYFKLKRTNDSLVNANERLMNRLFAEADPADTLHREKINNLRIDSLYPFRQFTFRGCKIVANSVNLPNNFLVLAGGTKDGFGAGMGVINSQGAVMGIITEVSEDFSVVMSLLHKDSKISGKLLTTGETGTVSWNGKEPNKLQFSGIQKSVRIRKGDTIITSGFSTTFPKGMLLGTVESAILEEGSNYLKIYLQSATDFHSVQFGYIIDNFYADEVNALLEKALKQP